MYQSLPACVVFKKKFSRAESSLLLYTLSIPLV